MGVMGCADVRERAPDLALGILEGEERAEVLAHLNTCARCQGIVEEYATIADLLPQLAHEAEPSSGFEARTLRAMRAPRRRTTRRWVAAIAATAAAAAIISIAVVRVIDADRERAPTAARLRNAEMTTEDGRSVGRVTIASGRPAALSVSVYYFVADGLYELQLSGAKDSIGTLTVRDGHGEWDGTATISERGPATLAMVDTTGRVVCQA